MDDSARFIEELAEWFERGGFQPHPDEYAQKKGKEEQALQRDLLEQLRLWLKQKPAGWHARRRGIPAYIGPFGYRYRPDLELSRRNMECVPVEVKLMKRGWEPNQAIGQAIMYSRVMDAEGALALVLDVRKNAPSYSGIERTLQRELWQAFGVRLCVRRA